MPITVQEDCARRYALLGSVITDDMICAGALNETEDDACQVSEMTTSPICRARRRRYVDEHDDDVGFIIIIALQCNSHT